MKKTVMFSAVCFILPFARAADFNDINVAEIKNTEGVIPPVQEMKILSQKCDYISGEITKIHLMAQTAKSMIYTYADTQAEFDEFLNMWKPILEKTGFNPTTTEYKDRMGILNYEPAEGRGVLRDFWADKLQYNALDENEIHKYKHQLVQGLARAGMPVIASFKIKHEVFRPTFNLYYATMPDENRDHEIQLRHLMKGEDIDYDLLENAGVNIVLKDNSFSMVYIGKEIGFVSKVSATEEGINKKLEEYKKFLAENKKELIGFRIHKLAEPFTVVDTTYNYQLNAYFYQ